LSRPSATSCSPPLTPKALTGRDDTDRDRLYTERAELKHIADTLGDILGNILGAEQ